MDERNFKSRQSVSAENFWRNYKMTAARPSISMDVVRTFGNIARWALGSTARRPSGSVYGKWGTFSASREVGTFLKCFVLAVATPIAALVFLVAAVVDVVRKIHS